MRRIYQPRNNLLLWGFLLGFASTARAFLGNACAPDLYWRPFRDRSPSAKTKTIIGRSDSNIISGRRSERQQRIYLFRPDWLRRASRVKKIREDNKDIKNSLRARLEELGTIGRQYRCINPETGNDSDGDQKKGMLKVYLCIPEDDFEARDKSNIVNRLEDGEIVTSISPERGCWIEHDAGGWSLSVLDGQIRLEPIEENSFQ